MPRAPRVATLTVREIITAEGAAIVMTRHATLRACRGVMHERLRRRDLSPLRQSRPDAVAIVAAETLPRGVFAVAEINRIRARPLRRPCVTPCLVTRAARRDVAPRSTLRTRRMTLITGSVRTWSRRDRERDAAVRRQVAGDTIRARSCRARCVPRVIEPDVKTSERGE